MAKAKELIKRLEIIIALLIVIVGIMALYIIYPLFNAAVAGQPVGERLSGINAPLNPTELAAINNASNNYFEIAGEKLLNVSISGEQESNNTYAGPLFEVSLTPQPQLQPLVINGKPSVIYIGATSCIYCGENRWAMALALSRFGSFNSIYTGYSSLGDGDVPTLYWVPQNITTNGSIMYGNDYQSKYVNFYSAEYDSPIRGGFEFPNLQNPIVPFVSSSPNSSYKAAMEFMNTTQAFQGTPFTFWGTSLNRGAAAVVFGNATSTSSTTTNHLPLSFMTHQQITSQLSQFNSTFAYEEYAGADVYVAEICASIKNAAPVCALPAIQKMETIAKI